MNIESVVAWIITGLLTTLTTIVGYIGKKIYDEIRKISNFISKQEELNRFNEKEHSLIHNKLDYAKKRIENHENRITKLELK